MRLVSSKTNLSGRLAVHGLEGDIRRAIIDGRPPFSR